MTTRPERADEGGGPDREIVVGTILGGRVEKAVSPANFQAWDRPGFSKAAMNFLVEPKREGWCRDPRLLHRRFGAPRLRRLVAIIYPGSAFLRRMWLRAIRRRAERAEP